ncbi:MAG: phosphotyrosine protein phosphatase [Sandaracinaceae bacterium]|nr:phosphotyrosine protein phosphatase [Sandaracinaceae bacterium]
MRVLFVCSRNQWRSPTAEAVFRRHPAVDARSAGTSPKARKTVSARDLEWADVICVMERKHAQRLRADYARLLGGKPLHVLEVPDEYRYMDPELVALLTQVVSERLGL